MDSSRSLSSGADSRDPLARNDVATPLLFSFYFFDIRNEAAGELHKAGGNFVADGQIVVAVGHHAKALGGIDENEIVGDVRAGFGRGGADDQRSGVDRPVAAGAFLHRIRCAACAAEAAAEILQTPADRAGLIDDRLRARGPVREGVLLAV